MALSDGQVRTTLRVHSGKSSETLSSAKREQSVIGRVVKFGHGYSAGLACAANRYEPFCNNDVIRIPPLQIPDATASGDANNRIPDGVPARKAHRPDAETRLQ
ncbi:hypothetical protein BaRGS_00013852 [Batillaria attramentaria]|uniref:Uncharacterized protein n=1 Tax=Batillaria attramentaria TaxID=370345 RepID=A0ABD0L6R9_9CAEN